MEQATNAVLQADGPRALSLFLAVEPASAAEARKRDCSVARLQGRAAFSAPPSAGHPLADAVLTAYRAYWREAVQPRQKRSAERQLLAALRAALGPSAPSEPEALFNSLSARLESLGLHNTLGRTSGLYDLLLYFRKEERRESVLLPDGHRETVPVVLMHDMVSIGWARHLNCGGPGTGGFATPQGLFALAAAYQLDQEAYRINFLAHEAQHYADYKRLPALEGPELEYRAKLTELALAEASLRETLGAFLANRSDARSNPHGWANKQVLADLSAALPLKQAESLMDVPPDALRAAARQLLLKDNAARGLAPAPN